MRSPPAHHQSVDQGQARFNRESADSIGHILGRAGVNYDIVSLTVGTSATEVRHRLGRRWQGWQVVDLQGNTNIWRGTPPAGTDPAEQLWVQAGASVLAKILVF